jgi:tetratricopeptide (TPR) repeat protein
MKERSCCHVRRSGLAISLAAIFTFWLPTQVLAQSYAGESTCGPLNAVQGDNRYISQKQRTLVEHAHFPIHVENLIRGHSGHLASDISYTLNAFPNHYRALISAVRYAEKSKTDAPPQMWYPVECWFDRAIRFKADDHIVRMLYADFLIKRSRHEEAIRQLDAALFYADPQSPITPYNVGFLYLEMKRYDKALLYAQRAQAMGFTNQELRRRLEAVGQWSEQPPVDPHSIRYQEDVTP